nr:polyadenylate-binding protein [Cryptomonas curvata]
MSRLIIKELSKNINEKYLHLLFSAYGIITDIKIIKNKDGKLRNFCFIGFLQSESAKKAIKNMNGSFILNKKIKLEEALPKLNKNIISFKKKNLDLIKLTENICETGFLFVRNISESCKINELETLFRNFGYLDFIKMQIKKNNQSFSTYAYVKFGLPECAIRAGIFLDGKIFQGRILHIVSGYKLFRNIYKNIEKTNFKKFQTIKSSFEFKSFFNHKSWFLLFIPEPTIIQCICTKFGKANNVVSNYKHLKINSGKQLVSEGRLQIEAFLILKKEGIDLNSFDPTLITYKSSKIILVKNFSINSKKDLTLLLGDLGEIKKYVVLPFTSLFIIEFKKKNDAEYAFNILKKFESKDKNVIVQWAPLNCFKNSILKNNLITHNIKKKLNLSLPWFKKQESCIKYIQKKNCILTKKFFKNYKILIRNLPFSINSEGLRNIFGSYDKIISVRIPKKKDGNNRGFGFVEFYTLEDAKKAFILIQNIHLEKRHLSCVILN